MSDLIPITDEDFLDVLVRTERGFVGELEDLHVRFPTFAYFAYLCRSVDEFERLRGTNLARFALDELTYTPEAAWMVLEGRLRDPKPSGCADLGSGRQKVTTGSTESSYQSRCEATTRPNRAARDWCRSLFQTLGGYGIAATGAFSIEW